MNRRKFCRISWKTQLSVQEIITPTGEKINRRYPLSLEDISIGGLCFSSKFPVPIATRLRLGLALPGRQIQCTVEVVRFKKTRLGGYEIGCRFTQLRPADESGLARFVTGHSVRRAQPSTFYSQRPPDRVIVPISCGDCRCANCSSREICRACLRRNCGRRYCRMYTAGRPTLHN